MNRDCWTAGIRDDGAHSYGVEIRMGREPESPRVEKIFDKGMGVFAGAIVGLSLAISLVRGCDRPEGNLAGFVNIQYGQPVTAVDYSIYEIRGEQR